MINHIPRYITKEFIRKIKPNKVLVLLGARRVGKTELLKKYLMSKNEESYVFLNGDDQVDVSLMDNRSVSNYKRLMGNAKLLVIDEAQKIPNIGQKLKLIVDTLDGIKVIATGSSAFDISGKLGEPLVGRKNVIHLYPLSQMEFSKIENYKNTKENLENRLIYGAYPELEQFASNKEKRDYLSGIVNDYLLRDILEYEGLRRSDKLFDLLRLIAFQISKEVSIQELGRQLGISKNTVERYLDMLSKVFVIFKLSGFSKNLRKEIAKSSKWYFYDTGIRNSLIQNFNPVNLRNDIGELWENYLVSERLKYQSYNNMQVNNYFWRTYDQQEIDWIEETGAKLYAFEFKWSTQRKTKIPGGWKKTYPDAPFKIINRDNYLDWIGA